MKSAGAKLFNIKIYFDHKNMYSEYYSSKSFDILEKQEHV